MTYMEFLRRQRCMTQTQLADLMSVNNNKLALQALISQWEKRQRVPTPDQLEELGRVLKFSPCEALLRGVIGKPEPPPEGVKDFFS